jgi:hypothetical protein
MIGARPAPIKSGQVATARCVNPRRRHAAADHEPPDAGQYPPVSVACYVRAGRYHFLVFKRTLTMAEGLGAHFNAIPTAIR